MFKYREYKKQLNKEVAKLSSEFSNDAETFDINNSNRGSYEQDFQVEDRKAARKESEFNPYTIEIPEICSICCDNFKSADIIVMLSCNIKHIYHELCIKKWFDMRRQTCPLCKRDVVKEAEELVQAQY